MLEINKIYQGHTPDVLKPFPDDSIDCVITSPPYWSLRDYQLEPQIWDDGWKGQSGLPTLLSIGNIIRTALFYLGGEL